MSNIKIQDVAQRIQYVATAAQTIFPVPYPFFENSELVVYKGEIILNQGAAAGEYGVAGAGSPSGGSITLVTASTAGDIITIIGNLAIDRTSIYSATISNLTGSDLNGDFNREVVMLKQVETEQSLMQLQYYPYAQVSQDPTVTVDRWLPRLGPDQVWQMNTTATKIIAATLPSGGFAPALATYILQIPTPDLPSSQALSVSASGFMSSVTATGVVSNRTFMGAVNQINVTNPTGLGDPGFAFSLTMSTPGTFTVNGSTVIDSIINDNTQATASATNVSTALAMKTYVDSNSGGIEWTEVTTTTQAAANDSGYVANNAALVTITLPAVAAFGSAIRIIGKGAGGWLLNHNAGQNIQIGSISTTVTTGSIASTNQFDSINLICTIANTTWTLQGGPQGSLTII